MFTGISINLVGRLRSGASLYAANGFYPDLTFDFYSANYAKSGDGFTSTLSDVANFARAGNATLIDADGDLQTLSTNTPRIGHHVWNGSTWVNEGLFLESESRTNLLLNSASLETQTVAVTPNEPHTISFYSGETVVDLDESIAATAVDVFVYDTSKDSDGGAWRTGALAQASSWYNETLNTATRGSRREFPAVAVIVAEATKVTIYDGDDPSLPMWRVTNRVGPSGASFWRSAVGDAKAISAAEGKVCFVQNIASPTGNQGLAIIDFAADNLLRFSGNTSSGGEGLPVSDDASTTAVFPIIYGADKILASLYSNDVAMTVLPDAPTDPATGLKVPTIAVATNGGVSVIKDDGTVAADPLGFACSSIIFKEDDDVYVVRSFTNDVFIIPTPAYNAARPDYTHYDSDTAPYILSGAVADLTISSFGHSNGLTILAEDQTTPANGMVAHVTSSWNSGYQVGNIKGAFLSDTDDTDLVGSGELVDASDFTDGSDGSSSVSESGGTITGTYVDGTLRYRNNGFATVVGQKYVVQATVNSGTPNFFVGNSLGSGVIIAGEDVSSGPYTFTALEATTYVSINDGEDFEVVDLSVKLADADRSVNNNGLIVNGTVTRSPVESGADLVGYSGFSASNYLEAPYNPDLDFGTGDFCVMGWVTYNSSASAGNNYIIDRQDGASSATDRLNFVMTSSSLVCRCDSTSASVSFSPINGVRYFAAVVRSGGVAYFYVNGDLIGSATQGGDVTDGSASYALSVGNVGSHAANESPLNMALLRISATAPTADQILKIYNDEKVLFQDNAQATLYGASDAVTALAYDEDTDLLHVGTSAGRSIFNGLRRINNTTTGVTTAISANNGVIAEQ